MNLASIAADVITFGIFVLQTYAAVLAADLAIASAHFAMDRFGDPACKVGFLATIFRNNRLHHSYPKAILRHGWINNMIETGVIGLASLATFWALDLLNWPTFVFSVVVAISGVVHRWQHMNANDVWKVVHVLQAMGLLQSRQQHREHHRQHDMNYSIITNHVNKLLEATKLFRGVEVVVEALSGKRPFDLAMISRVMRMKQGPAFQA